MKVNNVHLILLIYFFDILNFLHCKQPKQGYIIRIGEPWINEVKSESLLFGLKFKRKFVTNVYLFEENASNIADIKGFKRYFAKKIGPIKKREKVMVKYHTWRERRSEKPTFERWLLQPIKYAKTGHCWPYYGMDIQEAWSLGYTGLGVTVAIVDIGVDVNHPDLKRNIDMNLSFNFVDEKNHRFVDPQRFRSYQESEEITCHGTMAAGLIGGEFGNHFCSAGVAFNAKLAALKVFEINKEYIELELLIGFSFSVDKIPLALSHKNDDIDVYSCSFNLKDKFQSLTSEMDSALKGGVLKGRKGKGSIFVFSAGNRKGKVYDCTMGALANTIYTITISSVGRNGSIPSYAIPCATTLASTYGEFNTLRGSKTLKTTSHDGMCGDFKGTSASTALASGIIALTLEANPNLTWRDVQYIIVLSSTHDRLENAGVIMQNAAGLQYNSYFGFGLMNATAMTLLAKKWQTVPRQKNIMVKETKDVHRLLHENVLAVTLKVDKCYRDEECIVFVERIKVSLKYRKAYESNIDIILCSPAMSCSFLLNRKSSITHVQNPEKTENGVRNWTFSSVHFWGENPTGNWVLLVNKSNRLLPRDLNLQTVIISLYGTSWNHSEYFNHVRNEDQNESIGEELANLIEWYKKFEHLIFKKHPITDFSNISYIKTVQSTEEHHTGNDLILAVIVFAIIVMFAPVFCIVIYKCLKNMCII